MTEPLELFNELNTVIAPVQNHVYRLYESVEPYVSLFFNYMKIFFLLCTVLCFILSSFIFFLIWRYTRRPAEPIVIVQQTHTQRKMLLCRASENPLLSGV